MVVHDVEMHDISSGIEYCLDIVAKAGEVSG